MSKKVEWNAYAVPQVFEDEDAAAAASLGKATFLDGRDMNMLLNAGGTIAAIEFYRGGVHAFSYPVGEDLELGSVIHLTAADMASLPVGRA
jgi:hypothetical protein